MAWCNAKPAEEAKPKKLPGESVPSPEEMPGTVLDCAAPAYFVAEDIEVAPIPKKHEVIMVRTSLEEQERLKVHPAFTLSQGDPSEPTEDNGKDGFNPLQPKLPEVCLIVDPTVKFQTVLGFGGSFTESTADLFMSKSPEIRQRIIDAYFKPGSGNGYSMGRVNMGGTYDSPTGSWNCIEEGDTELATFSIQRYEASVLPMLRQAAQARGQPLKLMFSPRSPPGWMKDSNQVKGGRLLSKFWPAWASHYVRFAKEFEAMGIPFWGLTMQNGENCEYTTGQERDFIRDFLGPALETGKLDMKILFWDCDRTNMFRCARTVYSDPLASKYIWGLACHWHWDEQDSEKAQQMLTGYMLSDNVRALHEFRPDKHIIMSENCQEMGSKTGDWQVGERYAEAMIKDLNNWLEGWIDGHLILDRIDAPILVEESNDRIILLSHYFYIGHFSRYIQPGAQRVLAAANRDGLETTAFLNPDGTLVTVVLNRRDDPIDFKLQFGDWWVVTQALARSITTYISCLIMEA